MAERFWPATKKRKKNIVFVPDGPVFKVRGVLIILVMDLFPFISSPPAQAETFALHLGLTQQFDVEIVLYGLKKLIFMPETFSLSLF